MKIKIGILGLGHIGYYHVKALQDMPEYCLTAACDLNKDLQKLLPEGVAFYTDILDFFADDNFTTVIIATPNDTHFELGSAAYRAGKNVIMEKPAATTLDDFDTLDELFKNDKSLHIYYAFHAAKAFDVTWFKEYYIKENQQDFGPVTAFSCTFYDPYYTSGQIKQEAIELQNPWIDSGVNALSVLSEIINIADLDISASSKTRMNGKSTPVQAMVQFSFSVNGNGQPGLGTINTNWTLGLNQKKTYLFFALSGNSVEIDHSNQTVIHVSPEKKKIVLKDYSNVGERLYNHYVGVFKDYLLCLDNEAFNSGLAREIHKILFMAEHWRAGL